MFPFFDQSNQLWLATGEGIHHVEYPNQVSYFDDNSGVLGIPLSIDESDEEILVGTTEGLFILKKKGAQRFKRVKLEDKKWPDEYVTDMLKVDGDQLILTIYGLFERRGEEFIRITKDGGFEMSLISESPAKILFGGGKYVNYLSKVDGEWQIDHSIPAKELDVYSVNSQNENRSWVSESTISRIDFSDAGPVVTKLDSTHGFKDEMGPAFSFILDDKAFFCTPIGLYSWNDDEQKLESETLFGEEISKGAMWNPLVIENNEVWIARKEGLGSVDLSTGKFKTRDLKRVEYSDVYGIYPSDDGHIWFLTTEAIIRYDSSMDNSYQSGFNALIRGVTTKEDSVLFNGFFMDESGAPSLIQPDSLRPSLIYRSNQVSFKYGSTFYSAPEKTMYSTFLEGQDEEWSQWSNRPFKDYMNLREGQYTFKVKARNVYGVESEITTYSFSVQPPWYRTSWAYLLFTVIIALGVWGFAVLYSLRLRKQKIVLEGIVKDRTREIAEEKQKSDDLLLNILPEETATELKNQGYATTRSYDEVSILFTDFVSFSSIAETMTPEELVAEIDHCFSAFDEIVGKEGVEKIKTIGDAYMCAAGLHGNTSDHASRIVRVGIAIRDFMKDRNEVRMKQGLPSFQIRIGIHTGPVVAGVVGKRKFAYDIWGDAVNTAARMESKSEPGEINVSASTYEAIHEIYTCEYRGKIEAKNKGKLDMYFVRD